jgi:hypothetical protein
LFKSYKAWKQQVLQKIEHLRQHLTRRHKSIHLTLQVNTFFGNSTPATSSITESSSQKPRLTTASHLWHRRKREKEETSTQKVTKQGLSDYAQQD